MTRNVGEWVKIIDVESNEVLVVGQISKRKGNFETATNNGKTTYIFSCISFEDKWFFSETTTLNHFRIKDNNEHIVKELDINSIPSYYIKEHSKDVILNHNADIYREQDISEIDIEVSNLVQSLNLFEGAKTVSSCCGHNREPLWVDIQFEDIHFLCILLKILNKNCYKYDFVLRSDSGIMNANNKTAIMKLITTKIGEEAYKIADKLALELKMYAKILGE